MKIAHSLAAALTITTLAGTALSQQEPSGNNGGRVYTLTNETAGNRLAVFTRAADGTLTLDAMIPTGGTGTAGGLGNQGAIALDRESRMLFAVNAGSGQISAFSLRRGRVELMDVASSGGFRPVSIAVRDNLLYVLNAGNGTDIADNITGFRVGEHGNLFKISNSARSLSAANTGPAQIAFDNDGDTLVVTEKATNTIDTFDVRHNGRVGQAKPQLSHGATPFGFAFTRQGRLIVSEAFGGAADASAVSSYWLGHDGKLNLTDGSVPTTETAACWIANTSNGKFTYTTNTGAGTITGYHINRNTGKLAILNANGVTGVTGAGSGPTDEAIVGNRLLYVLNSPLGEIDAFAIAENGSLTPIQSIAGMPARATGLIAE